ncbi:flavodoxin domain-containing protein [Tropicibacter naphthalenivorans]|uniref:Protoporphyrinogen IX dehydrogenase [menaquinone] n=1 Tax=Tropicibacter naphthalenivorans TaxID=441103 RepID=A0A0P1GFC5_9RHOB|nr:flavodoxin domain-containing protein [Tropicibacter naphthalenivorans]CUH80038.1 Protoporphyrinogen IX dehydrogenase [menaquinone] [Tropicibacter naphthalenivorans]SMC83658.1 menaquinone-dependent protoporphyrinogen oxidase [Tropicibacter naphthalenivorans]
MRILIAYTTTEGQTRKIARFAADHLTGRGHSVELLHASDGEGIEAARFDAVILAGSIHLGRVQGELVDFARETKGLSALKSLYLQVSLAAADDDPDGWEELRAIAGRMTNSFGWQPQRVEHIAGAFKFTEYDFFKAWMMRRIAKQRDETLTPGQDREYTDWEALAAMLDNWAREAG